MADDATATTTTPKAGPSDSKPGGGSPAETVVVIPAAEDSNPTGSPVNSPGEPNTVNTPNGPVSNGDFRAEAAARFGSRDGQPPVTNPDTARQGAGGIVEVGGAGFREINDRNGNGVLDGIEHRGDLRPPGSTHDRPGLRTDMPAERADLPGPSEPHLRGRGPTFEPGGDGTPYAPGSGPTVVVDPVFPAAPSSGQHGDNPTPGHDIGPGFAQTNEPPAPVTSQPPRSELDTFETGTAPSNGVPALDPIPAHSPALVPAPVAAPQLQAEPDDEPGEPADDHFSAAERIGNLGSAIASGATLSAADVFDREEIDAAVQSAVKDTTEEGGANLLERIFDRVKDILFEEPRAGGPVQLPVQQLAVPAAELEQLATSSEAGDLTDTFEDEVAPDDEDELDDGL